jgi:hypothetical protein
MSGQYEHMAWNAVLCGQLHVPIFYWGQVNTHAHAHTHKLVESKIQGYSFMTDILLCYTDSKQKVQTISHNNISISLLLTTCFSFCEKLSLG